MKTSLAPGSRVVTDYLREGRAGQGRSTKLGFHTVGYGCTTCIGNSGPLPEPVAKAVREGDLVASAVLSGNRNFEGRVNPLVKANYLASPPLVVAYALAGTTDIDLTTEPLGDGHRRQAGLPRRTSGRRTRRSQPRSPTASLPEMFRQQYGNVFEATNPTWNAIAVSRGRAVRRGTTESTYIQEPPFLIGPDARAGADRADPRRPGAGGAGRLGHHRPHLAGRVDRHGQPGRASTCIEQGVEPRDFNSYGSRRGNDRVMTRGTFANIRIRNQLAPGTEGGVTRHLPDGEADADLRRGR